MRAMQTQISVTIDKDTPVTKRHQGSTIWVSLGDMGEASLTIFCQNEKMADAIVAAIEANR